MKLRDPYEFMGNGERLIAACFFFLLGMSGVINMAINWKHTRGGWIWGLFWIAAGLQAQGTLQRMDAPGRWIGWAVHIGFTLILILVAAWLGFTIYDAYFR